MAEISENVQPPRNMTSLHFDPGGASFVVESAENKTHNTQIKQTGDWSLSHNVNPESA